MFNAHIIKNFMSDNKEGKNRLKLPNQSIEAPFCQLESQKSSSALRWLHAWGWMHGYYSKNQPYSF